MIFDFLRLGSAPTRSDRHRLTGTIFVDGSPAQRLVVVVQRSTMVLVASTLSNAATGAWELYGLPQYDERDLLALALDSSGNYNAEVADYISQVTGS